MDYFIDNIESLYDLEYFIVTRNTIPQSLFERLKLDIIKELTTTFESSNNAEIKKILITNVVRKMFSAKKFINSAVEDLYVRRMLLDSYNSMYEEIDLKYKTNYPDLFKIEDSRSFYNIDKNFPINGYLLGKIPGTKTTTDATDNKSVISRNEILQIFFKNNKKTSDIFIKCEDKLVKHGYLNDDKTKWLKGASEFIRFYLFCEKNLLRKGIYENNSKGVIYFRDLYDFHIGKAIDVPSKRKLQITKTTKNEFDFLEF